MLQSLYSTDLRDIYVWALHEWLICSHLLTSLQFVLCFTSLVRHFHVSFVSPSLFLFIDEEWQHEPQLQVHILPFYLVTTFPFIIQSAERENQREQGGALRVSHLLTNFFLTVNYFCPLVETIQSDPWSPIWPRIQRSSMILMCFSTHLTVQYIIWMLHYMSKNRSLDLTVSK